MVWLVSPDSVNAHILKIVSGGEPVQAFKIHRILKEKGIQVTVQAVHKDLRALLEKGVLKRFERDYYLNPEWVYEIKQFVSGLEGGSTKIRSDEVGKGEEEKRLQKVRFDYWPIHFIPFYLGKKLKVLPAMKLLSKSGDAIMFSYRRGMYTWFKTGVCVLCAHGETQSADIVGFLKRRRDTHRYIIDGSAPEAKEIVLLCKLVNGSVPREKPFDYVLTVHVVDISTLKGFQRRDDVLKLLVVPYIFDLSDNPQHSVNEHTLAKAYKMLLSLTGPVRLEHVFDLSRDPHTRVFATWGNVVIGVQEWGNEVIKLFTEIEIELQHVWFLLNRIKEGMRGKKKVTKEEITCIGRVWEGFSSVDPQSDSYRIIAKEGLIKTSRVEQIYKQLLAMIERRRTG